MGSSCHLRQHEPGGISGTAPLGPQGVHPLHSGVPRARIRALRVVYQAMMTGEINEHQPTFGIDAKAFISRTALGPTHVKQGTMASQKATINARGHVVKPNGIFAGE